MLKFYDCSLEAALMNKNFGVVYGTKHQGKLVWECVLTNFPGENWQPMKDAEAILDEHYEGKFYIHPGSEDIYEIQVNDEGTDENDTQCRVTMVCDDHVMVRDSDSQPWPVSKEDFKIDKRKGIAFISPKEEDDIDTVTTTSPKEEEKQILKYYDCPVVAEVMAKLHGIEIYTYWKSKERKTHHNDQTLRDLDCYAAPYYINPDSFHILEPQLTDLCEFVATVTEEGKEMGEESYNIFDHYAGEGGGEYFGEEYGRFVNDVHVITVNIILRNGDMFRIPKEKENHD